MVPAYTTCDIQLQNVAPDVGIKRPKHVEHLMINPYPANVDNMASSYQCQQMADGIISAFKGLINTHYKNLCIQLIQLYTNSVLSTFCQQVSIVTTVKLQLETDMKKIPRPLSQITKQSTVQIFRLVNTSTIPRNRPS